MIRQIRIYILEVYRRIMYIRMERANSPLERGDKVLIFPKRGFVNNDYYTAIRGGNVYKRASVISYAKGKVTVEWRHITPYQHRSFRIERVMKVGVIGISVKIRKTDIKINRLINKK